MKTKTRNVYSQASNHGHWHIIAGDQGQNPRWLEKNGSKVHGDANRDIVNIRKTHLGGVDKA